MNLGQVKTHSFLFNQTDQIHMNGRLQQPALPHHRVYANSSAKWDRDGSELSHSQSKQASETMDQGDHNMSRHMMLRQKKKQLLQDQRKSINEQRQQRIKDRKEAQKEIMAAAAEQITVQPNLFIINLPVSQQIRQKIKDQTLQKYGNQSKGQNGVQQKQKKQSKNTSKMEVPKVKKRPVFSIELIDPKSFQKNNNDSKSKKKNEQRLTQKSQKNKIIIHQLTFQTGSKQPSSHDGSFQILESIQQIMPEEGILQIPAMKLVQQNKKIVCSFRRENLTCSLFGNPRFSLYMQKDNVLLMSTKKERAMFNSFYSISGSQNQNLNEKKGKDEFGFVQGNFGGTQFNLYNGSRQKKSLAATVCFKPQLSCFETYQKLQIYIKNPQFDSNIQCDNLKDQFHSSNNVSQKSIMKLVNKQPRWSERLKNYTLDFGGKSKMASTKNMILIQQGRPDKNVLLFCKTGSNDFHMQVGYPLSPFLGMGIMLTSFDFKIYIQ